MTAPQKSNATRPETLAGPRFAMGGANIGRTVIYDQNFMAEPQPQPKEEGPRTCMDCGFPSAWGIRCARCERDRRRAMNIE